MNNEEIRKTANKFARTLMEYGIRVESPPAARTTKFTGEEARSLWRIDKSHAVFEPDLVEQIAMKLRDSFFGRPGPPLEFTTGDSRPISAPNMSRPINLPTALMSYQISSQLHAGTLQVTTNHDRLPPDIVEMIVRKILEPHKGVNLKLE